MSSEIAIKVDNLCKCYQIYDNPRDRLMQMLMRGRRQYYREFWALRDVSFEVKVGETLGIIGRNGSGKSTLLQMICGTLNPTSGTVTTKGRIAALLELGSGFNTEFTGRENVYMNAAVLGLTKEEIDERFDKIAEFADIGDFIEQPVKTYSSGMMVRLAFAVQAQVDPDILVIDEALAVGDAKFQMKCFERLRQLKNDGTSILLVTHSNEQIVTHCSQALLLEGGNVMVSGEPKKVVNNYLDLLFGKEVKKIESSSNESGAEDATGCAKRVTDFINYVDDVFSTRPGYNPYEYRWGDGAAKILDFCLQSDHEIYPSSINTGQKINLNLSIKFLETLVRPVLGITIKNKEGVTVYGVNSETLNVEELKFLGNKDDVVAFRATFYCRLAPGDYFISLGLATKKGEDIVPHDRRYDSIHILVRPVTTFFGLVDLGLELKIEEIVG